MASWDAAERSDEDGHESSDTREHGEDRFDLDHAVSAPFAPLREVTRRDSHFLVQQRGKIKRILDRDAGESQSTRVYWVRKKRKIYAMFFYDFFHTILQVPVLGVYPMVFISYALCHLLFAIMWWSISDSCAIGLSGLMSAFYFSVETQMTIGYGAPAENFAGCPEAVLLLPLQVVCGQMLDAAVIGIVFAQISAASAHAASVMFSDTALLRVVDGCVQLTFRIAKRTGFSLSQGKIQVYCIQHHKDPSQPRGVRVEVNAMHLIEPDMDMYNGVIFLGLPAEVSHKVDFNSPLAPVVPAGTSGYPSELDVRTYLKSSKYLEILVLVSGVEQTTAANFEARHSYTLEDLFWNRTFEPCVSINKDGQHTVDLQKFHCSHMNRDEAVALVPDRAVSVRTHHSFRATLEPQVADWTIYRRGRAPLGATLDELFAYRTHSHSDLFTRQNSYNAGDSP